MVIIEREAQTIPPGNEPEHIKSAITEFFSSVDSAFPDKLIVWERWDHDKFDKPACTLCEELGYSAGAPFLTAYGYSIITPNGLITPADKKDIASKAKKPKTADKPAKSNTPETQAKPKKPKRPGLHQGDQKIDDVYHAGRIIHVLANGSSGFIREHGTRKDYYFNVRYFDSWVDKLDMGREVRFKAIMRLDQKTKTMRPTAISIKFAE